MGASIDILWKRLQSWCNDRTSRVTFHTVASNSNLYYCSVHCSDCSALSAQLLTVNKSYTVGSFKAWIRYNCVCAGQLWCLRAFCAILDDFPILYSRTHNIYIFSKCFSSHRSLQTSLTYLIIVNIALNQAFKWFFVHHIHNARWYPTTLFNNKIK